MYELAIPIFITVWMLELGVGPATIGIAVAVGYALYGIGSVPGGLLTDAYGSKRMLVICLLGMGSAFLILSLVNGLFGLTLALALWGLAASIYHPAGLRLISTGVSQRGLGFGYHGIAGNVGIALGPLIATTLLIVIDWQLVAAILAVPALVFAAYTTAVSVDELATVDDTTSRLSTTGDGAVGDSGDGGGAIHNIDNGEDDDDDDDDDDDVDVDVDDDHNGDGEELATRPDRTPTSTDSPGIRDVIVDTRMIFAGGFLVAFPMVILEGFFYRGVLTFLPDMLASYESLSPVPIFGERIDPSGYVFVGLLIVGMAGQYVGGRVSDVMAPEKALIGAFLALAAISVLFVPAASTGLVALLLVSALLGFVLFGEQPLLQAVIADYSGSAVRGLSYGYMFLGVFGIGALGAAVSGVILASHTQQVLFLLLAIVPFLAALIATALWRTYGFE